MSLRFSHSLLLFLLLSAWNLCGQDGHVIPIKNVNSKKFLVEDGILLSRIRKAIIDHQGFLWLQFATGLQVWNGKTFQTIHSKMKGNKNESHMVLHPDSGILYQTNNGVSHICFEGLQESH